MLAGRLNRHSFAAPVILLLFFTTSLFAAKWDAQYIRSLPDSAFASVEVTKDGKKIRHLPHHNLEGEVDINHLKSGLSRVHQVNWINPENSAMAKEHLEQHYRDYRLERGNTSPSSSRDRRRGMR